MEFGSPEVRYADPEPLRPARRRFRPWLCPAQTDFLGSMVRCWNRRGHTDRHECGALVWYDEVDSAR